ncbi:MAG TPA: AAA family ATPase [Fimbriimonadaceae bacterium]|nr:AAA family ATPase [Fimbriimonadaceae bacterium]
MEPGRIVILNGVPGVGKSTTVRAIQALSEEIWINLGVDVSRKMLPERLQPGIGLRPGGERPDLEPTVLELYRAQFAAIAAYSRQGLNVVAEFGIHDSYSKPLGTLTELARTLEGLPALFVGLKCPPEVILERRIGRGESDDGTLLERIDRWVDAVHRPGIYDLEVNTSTLTPEECAYEIHNAWDTLPKTAIARAASYLEK